MSSSSSSSSSSSFQPNFDSLNLTGKVALVTGGGSGIGRATAILLAERGCLVTISGRREKELRETITLIERAVASCTKEEKTRASYVVCDVSKEEEVKKMIEQVVAEWGKLDFAFNNAGIAESGPLLHEVDTSSWQKIQDTNVNGVFYCQKYELAQFMKQRIADKQIEQDKHGDYSVIDKISGDRQYAIVNTSSVDGLRSSGGQTAYNTSKHAVIGLTTSAATDYAQFGIRCNVICPGWVTTEMTASESQRGMMASTPLSATLGEVATGNDMAEVVAFLMSPAARMVTGVVMPVDGGFLL